MNFRDQWATDESGQKFVFTVEMQRRLSQAGLPVEPESLRMLNGGTGPAQARASAPEPAAYKPAAYKPAETTFEEPAAVQIDPETGKYIGRLKWYNPLRGYGFISRGGGVDIFFHKTSTLGNPEDLAEGQWVLYDVEERKKGPEATEVEPYSGEAAE